MNFGEHFSCHFHRTSFYEQCHKRGNCSAYGKKCKNCLKPYHFAKCCPNKSANIPKKSVKQVDCDSSDSDQYYAADDTFFVGSVDIYTATSTSTETQTASSDVSNHEFIISAIGSESETKSEWTIDMETNGSNVRYKLDTGAQVNVLPKYQHNRLLQKPKLKSTKVKLTAYNGTNIPVAGRCIVQIAHKKDRKVLVMFIVAETSSPPILGLSTCENLNLIKRVMVVKSKEKQLPSFIFEFESCFGELGTLPKVYKIVVDPSVSPVVHHPRRVPIAIQPKLKEELDRTESLGVISKVTKPTYWVSSLVIVHKPDGRIRVCLDPKDLNAAIKRSHLQSPTAEDIISKMSGARYFSKLDASSGYWQTKLDEESSKLLCFKSPFGRYKFNRLPFGVSNASEIFKWILLKSLKGSREFRMLRMT